MYATGILFDELTSNECLCNIVFFTWEQRQKLWLTTRHSIHYLLPKPVLGRVGGLQCSHAAMFPLPLSLRELLILLLLLAISLLSLTTTYWTPVVLELHLTSKTCCLTSSRICHVNPAVLPTSELSVVTRLPNNPTNLGMREKWRDVLLWSINASPTLYMCRSWFGG